MLRSLTLFVRGFWPSSFSRIPSRRRLGRDIRQLRQDGCMERPYAIARSDEISLPVISDSSLMTGVVVNWQASES